MYISYVNTVAKDHLFTTMFSQLSTFTAISAYPDGRCRNHMGVAHFYCYEILALVTVFSIALYTSLVGGGREFSIPTWPGYEAM